MGFAIAGATSGLLMASVFVSVGPIILFFVARDPPELLRGLLTKASSLTVMVGLVLLAFPTWGVIGMALGLLYGASTTDSSPSGAGSPNLAYTASVVAVGLGVAAPTVLLARRATVGVGAIALMFIGIFGWLLPFLAS